jgi:hypothetical protein
MVSWFAVCRGSHWIEQARCKHGQLTLLLQKRLASFSIGMRCRPQIQYDCAGARCVDVAIMQIGEVSENLGTKKGNTPDQYQNLLCFQCLQRQFAICRCDYNEPERLVWVQWQFNKKWNTMLRNGWIVMCWFARIAHGTRTINASFLVNHGQPYCFLLTSMSGQLKQWNGRSNSNWKLSVIPLLKFQRYSSSQATPATIFKS